MGDTPALGRQGWSATPLGGWVGAAEAQAHTLTVSKAGFETQHLDVQLVAGRETQVEVQMRRNM